jgi:hypothetical protein
MWGRPPLPATRRSLSPSAFHSFAGARGSLRRNLPWLAPGPEKGQTFRKTDGAQ